MTAALDLDSDLFRVLADPVRARIVQLLAREQLCTCHLVDELGITQSGVSNALRVLREAEVVESEPCGRFTYYRLRPTALEQVADRLGALALTAGRAGRRPC